MASVGNGNLVIQGNFRAAVIPLYGNGSQRAQGIYRGHSGSSKLDSCRLTGQVFPQLGKNLIFQGSQAIPGTQDLVFQLLQLGGDVTLAVGQGLLADVVHGHLIRKGLGNFDVITENPVIADLQGADAGLFFFRRFDGGQSSLAAVHNIPQAVSFGVGAGADNAAFPNGQGRIIHNGAFNFLRAVCQRIHDLLKLLQQRRINLTEQILDLRQSPNTPGKAQQIPTVDAAGDDPGLYTLQIGNILQGFDQLAAADGVVYQFLHSSLSVGDLQRIQ